MSFRFGTRSLAELSTCHEDLVKLANAAIQVVDIDFAVIQGARTIEQQREYFEKGTSKLDPDRILRERGHDALYKTAKHLVDDSDERFRLSRAFDIMAYPKEVAWDEHHLCYLAGQIMTLAKQMGLPIRWGGNWDRDGIIIKDQTFQDLVHFELTNR